MNREVPLVFDTSAWLRQRQQSAQKRWLSLLEHGLLAVCPMVALELCATARDDRQLEQLERALAALAATAPVTDLVTAAARTAVRDLGSRRRLPAADYLIAAAAAERGFGVLHYDAHFDLLATVLPFESVWIAKRGSLP